MSTPEALLASLAKSRATIRNRIVGHGDVAPDQLLANPLNFRRHPGEQLDALRGSMRTLGWFRTILVNKRTGHVIDGHARVEEALRRGIESIPVTYVDLSEDEERQALLAHDPIAAMAYSDPDTLKELYEALESQEEWLEAVAKSVDPDVVAAAEGTEDEVDLYTKKIEAPVYEPTGERPPLSALFDRTKAEALDAAIDAADRGKVPDEVKAFLRLAAARHTVFHYGKIAEYYAHAPPEVQALMEDSALVIIDFKKAIEDGFVVLSRDLGAAYEESGEDAE